MPQIFFTPLLQRSFANDYFINFKRTTQTIYPLSVTFNAMDIITYIAAVINSQFLTFLFLKTSFNVMRQKRWPC